MARLRLWRGLQLAGLRERRLSSRTLYENYKGGAVCEMIQAVIAPDGKSVAGGDSEWCGYSADTFNRWNYPAGGKPTSTRSNFNAVYGTAIRR